LSDIVSLKAPPNDGEVLSIDIHDTAVDGAMTGDNAVAKVLLLVETEIDGAMGHEHIRLFEAAFVEQDGDTFTGSHLALRVRGSRCAFGRHRDGPHCASLTIPGFSVQLT
jgi:hypothetical protein